MRTETIKQTTVNEVKKVLKKNKKFYTSSDFSFVQIINFYITYKGRIMNEFLRSKGFTIVQAKDVDLNRLTGRTDVKVRTNRNIWIKTKNYINYKK